MSRIFDVYLNIDGQRVFICHIGLNHVGYLNRRKIAVIDDINQTCILDNNRIGMFIGFCKNIKKHEVIKLLRKIEQEKNNG